MALYKNNPVYPSSLQAMIWNYRTDKYYCCYLTSSFSVQIKPKCTKKIKIVINMAEQMAVYDGKLVKPEWIKRETWEKKKRTIPRSNTERQSHNVVYKQQVTQLSHFSFY